MSQVLNEHGSAHKTNRHFKLMQLVTWSSWKLIFVKTFRSQVQVGTTIVKQSAKSQTFSAHCSRWLIELLFTMKYYTASDAFGDWDRRKVDGTGWSRSLFWEETNLPIKWVVSHGHTCTSTHLWRMLITALFAWGDWNWTCRAIPSRSSDAPLLNFVGWGAVW